MILAIIGALILAVPIYMLCRFAIGFIAGARAVIRGDLEPDEDTWPDT